MKSQLSWQEYQTLEMIPQRPSQRRQSQLNKIWQSIVTFFAASEEPHVWKGLNQAGQSMWKAYDPITHQSADYETEEEMRAWLEERHYQYHRCAG